MEKGERNNVYRVYDKIAAWFAENRINGLLEQKYLERLISLLPKNALVLDLGCGTGKPILEYLSRNNMAIIGVDASEEILKIAQANFPTTTFILQDMRLLNLKRQFDAIIAWHSFFHLSAAEQPAMFARFASHLKPGGILLFTSGTERGEAWGMNGGENLFHASLDPKEYLDLLQSNNFTVIEHVEKDPECNYDTVWLAKFG
ncbi:class I SAM-dependent methyltransferase [Pedobacter duraquae]|uniref:Methyltransferase family protein n=1 Tax=Pedobacter duraquae TaxID=425511 RepID=A0A4R6INN1_9SPHI|nr:class I SAM-dependent methyltransferase [Pedobacter duraquae]TDO23869.1 methyltransferase family protein [Pedobacter duraquae]